MSAALDNSKGVCALPCLVAIPLEVALQVAQEAVGPVFVARLQGGNVARGVKGEASMLAVEPPLKNSVRQRCPTAGRLAVLVR